MVMAIATTIVTIYYYIMNRNELAHIIISPRHRVNPAIVMAKNHPPPCNALKPHLSVNKEF